MGVQARIVLWAPGERAARRGARAAFARIARIDGALSDWREGGELERIQARAALEPVRVGEDLAGCLARALEVAEATGGAFDPTLGSLTRLWRAACFTGVELDRCSLEAARARTGWRRVRLDPATRMLAIEAPGLELDLGGIGKGWAADRALETLAELGIERALVALAGDIALGAPPPGEAGWTVALPADSAGAPLVLARCGVSTSGDDEQALERDGVRESHVLDPATGRGVVGHPRVTVIAPDATTADALATAIHASGIEAAEEWLERFAGARFLGRP
jgi:thiamine biosynthesis lipoprotein